jgi:hypothetical protein
MSTLSGTLPSPVVYDYYVRPLAGNSVLSVSEVPGISEPSGLVLADVDGDGDNDLVVGEDANAQLKVYLNDGSGNFSYLTQVSIGGRPWALRAGDFNADGNVDLVVSAAWYASKVFVLRGDGTGAFVLSATLNTTYDAHPLALADVDGDGDQDILAGSWNSTNPGVVQTFRNDGGFAFQAVASATTVSNVWSLATGDLDGDGDADLIAGDGNGSAVEVFVNNGQGTFAWSNAYAVPGLSVVTGDMDGDGDVDVTAVGRLGAGNVSVLRNGGNGQLTVHASATAGMELHTSSLVDTDADGDLDLIASETNLSGGRIVVYSNQGDGSLGVAESTQIANSPLSDFVAIGDTDGDGSVDLVYGNGTSNRVLIISTNPRIGLVAYYPLNGNGNDSSTSAIHASVNGPSPTTTDGCRVGQDDPNVHRRSAPPRRQRQQRWSGVRHPGNGQRQLRVHGGRQLYPSVLARACQRRTVASLDRRDPE